MPSLRELLRDVLNHDGNLSQPAYALWKALVERFDGGEHTCEECRFFSDYHIFHCRNTSYQGGRRTTAMRSICHEFRVKDSVTAELAEAKAEIERLRKRNIELAGQVSCFQEVIHSQSDRLAEWLDHAQAHKADVELRQLVLGMRDGTAIQHTGRQYYAMTCCPGLGWRPIAASCATDPAEALAAIQKEEGDA